MNEIEGVRAKLKCMEMVQGTNYKWWEVVKCKYKQGITECRFIPTLDFSFDCDQYDFEIALGMVEGKPVWKGDRVYFNDDVVYASYICDFTSPYWTWNQQVPDTIMIEIPISVAKVFDKYIYPSGVDGVIVLACRKALTSNGKIKINIEGLL